MQSPSRGQDTEQQQGPTYPGPGEVMRRPVKQRVAARYEAKQCQQRAQPDALVIAHDRPLCSSQRKSATAPADARCRAKANTKPSPAVNSSDNKNCAA